jgi:hypothetical protein
MYYLFGKIRRYTRKGKLEKNLVLAFAVVDRIQLAEMENKKIFRTKSPK